MAAEEPLVPHREDAAPLRVFLVEDHVSLREILSVYFVMLEDMELCGEAHSGEEALRALAEADPDLVLVDFSLPGMNGVELIQKIRTRHPHMRCLVLSGHKQKDYSRQAVEAGAHGYVLKGDPLEVAEGIRHAAAGLIYVSPELEASED